jgi:hypothetical protein
MLGNVQQRAFAQAASSDTRLARRSSVAGLCTAPRRTLRASRGANTRVMTTRAVLDVSEATFEQEVIKVSNRALFALSFLAALRVHGAHLLCLRLCTVHPCECWHVDAQGVSRALETQAVAC